MPKLKLKYTIWDYATDKTDARIKLGAMHAVARFTLHNLSFITHHIQFELQEQLCENSNKSS